MQKRGKRVRDKSPGSRANGLTGLRLACAIGALFFVSFHAGAETASKARSPATTLEDALLRDPTCPSAGNPDGDVTVIVFADYNCPFCRSSAGDLKALITSDQKVRVIYKDWPILAKSSLTAAKVAIASAWQRKYSEVHEALMHMNARPARDEDITQAVIAAGVDISRLNRDLDQRDEEIVALIKRNMAEADALGLQGTPVYIIGDTIEATPLDAAGFRDAVARARQGSKP